MSRPADDFPDSEQLPLELLRDLEALEGAEPSIPRQRDMAILDAARSRLIHALWRRRLRRFALPAAAAAVLLMAVLMLPMWLTGPPRVQAPAMAVAGDVDASGTVDILDAFALQRFLRSGATRMDHDFNTDGTVNADDVKHVAQLAVRLH